MIFTFSFMHTYICLYTYVLIHTQINKYIHTYIQIEGGRPFNLHLDAALITASSRAMAPVKFELPHSRFFPHMDLDFSGPLRYTYLYVLIHIYSHILIHTQSYICS